MRIDKLKNVKKVDETHGLSQEDASKMRRTRRSNETGDNKRVKTQENDRLR